MIKYYLGIPIQRLRILTYSPSEYRITRFHLAQIVIHFTSLPERICLISKKENNQRLTLKIHILKKSINGSYIFSIFHLCHTNIIHIESKYVLPLSFLKLTKTWFLKH